MGFGGSIFIRELHKAAIMSVTLYCAHNVRNSSLFMKPAKFIESWGLESTFSAVLED